MTFEEGRDYCQNRGGDLVAIESEAENKFINEHKSGKCIFERMS